jgi:drug/metabolite transporter (DMT)-like permease
VPRSLVAQPHGDPALSAPDEIDAATGPAQPPQTPARERRAFWLGTALIVLSACCFGLITTLSRIAYDSGGTPNTQVFLRFVAFVILIGPLMKLLGRPMLLPRAGLTAALGIAMLMLMMSAGYLFSVAYIPVSLAAMIFYTFPLMVGVLAAATGREPVTTIKIVALLGAFAGLALALGPSFASLDPRGVALALTAAVGVALTTLFGARAMAGYDGLTFNFWTNAWMLVFASAFVAVAGGLAWPDSVAGGGAAILGTLLYVGAFIAWFAALRLIAPTYGAVMLNVEPVVSVAAATLLLGEQLGPMQVAGVVLVLGMLSLMAARGGRKG